MEHIREIGVMQVIGASSGAVQRIFIFEGVGDRCAEIDHCHPAGPAAGHHRGQHIGECPYRRPPGPRFFVDRGHSMAGHRVGLLGHCQFLPCLESVPVDCERCIGK